MCYIEQRFVNLRSCVPIVSAIAVAALLGPCFDVGFRLLRVLRFVEERFNDLRSGVWSVSSIMLATRFGVRFWTRSGLSLARFIEEGFGSLLTRVAAFPPIPVAIRAA